MGAQKPKGELGEIRASLQQLAQRGWADPQVNNERRELFRRIIHYMTIGIDLSPLFMEVVKHAAGAHDLPIRKMLFLYICNYARASPDLVVLTINILLKDCQSDDPTVRGLALRSLCSLRVKDVVEYLVGPVRRGLDDKHSYVRRTAVIGVLKVHALDARVAADAGLVAKLQEMLAGDRDAQVVATCLQALVRIPSAAPVPGKALVYGLLNRVPALPEALQCAVLSFVSRYRPGDESEVFDILNALEDRMQSSSPGVLLAASRVMLHATLTMPATHQQVLERIRGPLLTQASSQCPEIAYTVLCHIKLLAQRAPFALASSYKQLFCRYSDPTYVKSLKLDILALIANVDNAYDIVTELSEYAADVDPALARGAVRAVGAIALRCPDAQGIVERLLAFLGLGRDHVVAETLVLLPDLVRRYPDAASLIVDMVGGTKFEEVVTPEARAALLWLLGHHGAQVEDAPYTMEAVAKHFATEEAPVRLALLSACVRLFYGRPAEVRPALAAALAASADDPDQDVRDRAATIVRLLRAGPDQARAVLAPLEPEGREFEEGPGEEAADQIFEEFGTLSVVYNAPAHMFASEPTEIFDKGDGGEDEAGAGGAGIGADAAGAGANPQADLIDGGASLLGEADRVEDAASGVDAMALGGGAGSAQAGPALLDLEDLLGGDDAPGPGAAAGAGGGGEVRLAEPAGAPVAGGEYLSDWAALPALSTQTFAVEPTALVVLAHEMDRAVAHVASRGLATVGRAGAVPKITLQLSGALHGGGAGSTVLLEVAIDCSRSEARLTVKGRGVGPAGCQAAERAIQAALGTLA